MDKKVLYLPANKYDAARFMSNLDEKSKVQFLRAHPEYTQSGSETTPPSIDLGKARFLDTYNKVRSVSQSRARMSEQDMNQADLNHLLDCPTGSKIHAPLTADVGSSVNCAGITSAGSGRDISQDPDIMIRFEDDVILEPYTQRNTSLKPMRADVRTGYEKSGALQSMRSLNEAAMLHGRGTDQLSPVELNLLARALISECGFVTNENAPTRIIDDQDGKRFDHVSSQHPLTTESRAVHEDLGDAEEVHEVVNAPIENEGDVDMDLAGDEGLGQPEHPSNAGRESNEGATLADANVQVLSTAEIGTTQPTCPESTAEVDGAQTTSTATDPNNNERGVNDWLREGAAKATQFALSESGRAVIGMAVPIVGKFLAKRLFTREVPENPRKRRRVVPLGRARNTVDLGESIEESDSE
jgi:hypothetical protein